MPSSVRKPPWVLTAWGKDGVIHGIRHKERPLHGIQFHPEVAHTPPRIVNVVVALQDKGGRTLVTLWRPFSTVRLVGDANAPVRSIIVGIIDRIDTEA